MAFCILDDGFYDDPDIDRYGIPDASLAWFVCALSYCGKQLTNGFIASSRASKLPGGCDQSNIDALTRPDKPWIVSVEGGYQIRSWRRYNPDGEEVKEKQEAARIARSEGGKKGMAARWGKKREAPLEPENKPDDNSTYKGSYEDVNKTAYKPTNNTPITPENKPVITPSHPIPSHPIPGEFATSIEVERATPFARAEQVLTLVGEKTGGDPPTAAEVRKHLKPACPLQQLLAKFEPEEIAAMYVWAAVHFRGGVTWNALFDQRNTIILRMREEVENPNGKRRESIAEESERMLREASALRENAEPRPDDDGESGSVCPAEGWRVVDGLGGSDGSEGSMRGGLHRSLRGVGLGASDMGRPERDSGLSERSEAETMGEAYSHASGIVGAAAGVADAGGNR